MQEEFVRAIRRGDSDDVRRLLRQGADVNQKWREGLDYGPYLEGVTPLMIAAAAPKSNVEIVRILLEAGADLKEVSDGKVAASWYAAGGGTGEKNLSELDPDHPYLNWGGGDVDRLRAILDAGGDPNESSNNGRTSVSEACSLGDPQRLALLIERGASVSPLKPKKGLRLPSVPEIASDLLLGIKFSYLAVPLFEAAKSGNLACVKLVVEAGFPVDFKSDKQTALNHATQSDITEYLLQAGLKNEPGPFGFDAIDNAFESENFDVARVLLDAIPSETKQAILQDKLMLSAGLRMSPTAMQMLIDMGADVTLPHPDYGSALHTACWQGDGNNGRENSLVEETVTFLIDRGADIELWNKRGETPLFEAVEGDWASPTSVRVLLLRGANIHVTNQETQTPLIVAAKNGSLECVQLLVAAGSDRTKRDASNMTALDHAKVYLSYFESEVKLPLSSRIINKLLGVKIKIDQPEIARTTLEMIRLLEGK